MSIQERITMDAVVQIVREIAERQGIQFTRLIVETSLTEDLAFDSLMLVELCVALEQRLGIRGAALEEWLDEQEAQEGPRLTLGALVAACEVAGLE